MDDFPLRPSYLAREIACPGAYHLRKKGLGVDIERRSASVGTRLHELLSEALVSSYSDVEPSGSEPLDPATQVARDEIRSRIDASWFSYQQSTALPGYLKTAVTLVTSEETIFSQSNRILGSEFFLRSTELPIEGTVDVFYYEKPTGRLLLFDFKSGNLRVSARGNRQLQGYAILLLEILSRRGCKISSVEAHIIQPSSLPPNFDSSVISTEELVELKSRIHNTLDPKSSSDLKLGDHCFFCPVRTSCSLFSGELLKIETEAVTADNRQLPLDADRLEFLYQLKPVITRYLNDLNQMLLNLVKSGVTLARHKVVRKMKNRTWRLGLIETSKRLESLGIPRSDFVAPTRLVSPSALIRKHPDLEEELSLLSHREEGDLYIAPYDDRRIEVEIKPSIKKGD